MSAAIPENLAPEEIERRSFERISAELGDIDLPPENLSVLKRVIHTTADFDYARNLRFSDAAVAIGIAALRRGAAIVTDTTMAKAGINKATCDKLGCEATCHIGDADVARDAKAQGITRSRAAVDKAAHLWNNGIFVVGNAPTALIRLYEHLKEGRFKPALVIGVPVGFVHVVESKELIWSCDVPQIVAFGRKGGSTVAAAIVNALLYQAIA